MNPRAADGGATFRSGSRSRVHSARPTTPAPRASPCGRVGQTNPIATIGFATFTNPATLAPIT